ncbi:MAG TPA: T9SS type A sorting domain-containing protein [Saprospiraceae bacterium]|nr:T9SS type A sorting domain-containing protein [Saprospiraceae bacterium]
MKSLIIFYFSLFTYLSSNATTWLVGSTSTYTFCSQVASLVQDGDTILIEAGVYINDPQVKWSKNNLYIAGIGGRPRLEAGDIIANDLSNGKGIFVIGGNNVHVHNIEFANAKVKDHNGAGIRQEGANLWVTNCFFDGNEMGILAGNISNCKTTVEYCEFVHGGSVANPGYQHNIYINHIDTLVFRYNYTHNAIAEGHELKSRATYNIILYNRIANEDSEDSRTIDLPNGGTSVIVGNIIEQGPNSANSNLVGFGLEGLTNPAPHALYCTNNTFVNKKSTGSFIQVRNGTDTLYVKNNIFAGAKTGGLLIGTPTVLDSSNNEINNAVDAIGFEDADNHDYHLSSSSIVMDRGISLNKMVNGYSLQPSIEYVDTCNFISRASNGTIDIGAFEYGMPSATQEAGEINFLVYPNPANDNFWIEYNAPVSQRPLLIVSNVNGEVVLNQRLDTGKMNLNTTTWGSGIYFLRVQNGIQSQMRKLVVNKI